MFFRNKSVIWFIKKKTVKNYIKKTGAFPPQNAMQIVGFMDHEAESVLEVVAAVLKLGNIEFKPESRVNGLDESKIKDKNGKSLESHLF